MANLRRTKLKAKRCGCNVIEVDKCTEISQVIELMQARDNTPKDLIPNGADKPGGFEDGSGK